MLALDSDGCLTLWDTLTMVETNTINLLDSQGKGKVRDFLILEMDGGTSCALSSNRLLIMRELANAVMGTVEIRSLPECSLIYSVNVAADTLLIKSPNGQNEDGAVAVLEPVMGEHNRYVKHFFRL